MKREKLRKSLEIGQFPKLLEDDLKLSNSDRWKIFKNYHNYKNQKISQILIKTIAHILRSRICLECQISH